MSIIINYIDGSSKKIEDVHFFKLKDGRSFLYYYDYVNSEFHWADLYIIDGKYYKTYESSISDPKQFMRLLNRNMVNSRPLVYDVQEVSSEDIQNMISLRTEVDSLPPINPPSTPSNDNFSNPPVPPLEPIELPKHNDVLSPVIAIPIYDEQLKLMLYSRQDEGTILEKYDDEDYGSFKHYYCVKFVGIVKLSKDKYKTVDDIVIEMLSSNTNRYSLVFNDHFVIEDLLLNYSTQSHRCEDKNLNVRDFIADDYISNNEGREHYKHYSNGFKSKFVGLKRIVFHRNSYEINRDFGKNQGRSK